MRGGKILFESLSFALEPSDVLVVTGPNGSGKTSLLRLVTGLLGADEGSFTWQGVSSTRASRLVAGSVHYLGHSSALKPFLTVRENLYIWAKLFGDGAGLDAAAMRTGVGEFLDFPVKYLSEGQKKRVNLARFLTTLLPLWVMDEPSSGLDTEGQKLLSELITEHLEGGGIAIIAAHHNLGLKKARTLRLAKGKHRWGK